MTTAMRTTLLLMTLGLALTAQTSNCGEAPSLELEVGVAPAPGASTWTWGCSTSGQTFGRFRITGPEGAWVFVYARVAVNSDVPQDQARLAAFLTKYPWLAKRRHPSDDLHPSLGGQAVVRMDPATITSYTVNCLQTTAPAWPLPSQQVRLWCQPILDLDDNGPLTQHAVTWDAWALAQNDFQLGTLWGGLLLEPLTPDTQTFSFWSLMEGAIVQQAPSAKEGQAFLQNGQDLSEALSLGTTVWVQAFGMIDPDPLLDPTPNPLTTPGLPSLDLLPPSSPDFLVSSAIPIPILPGIPLGGPPPGGGGGPYSGAPGSILLVRLDRRIDPCLIHFPGPQGQVLVRRLHYLRPGLSFTRIPDLVSSGPLDFSNPFGSTVGTTASLGFTVATTGGGTGTVGGQ